MGGREGGSGLLQARNAVRKGGMLGVSLGESKESREPRDHGLNSWRRWDR